MVLSHEEIKNLKDKNYRKQNQLFKVEGNKFCADILHSNIEIVYTITSDKNLQGFPNIVNVSEKVLSSLATTKTNQSIICICKAKQYSIESVGNSLILDEVQDPGNVGTLIRSAVAFGFEDIYLINTADVYSEKVLRSSAGIALNARLHITSYDEVKQNKNKIANHFIVADMIGENINKIRLPKKRVAVIIGNEGRGVSDILNTLADIKVSIPMSTKVESLNAGVAGSIIMQKFSEV